MLVSDSVQKAQCVVGVFTNVLLLYVIRRHTRSPLGAYKHLLTTFATVDLLLTVIHLVVEPILPSLWGGCFSVPFALMNIHFLYRYWAVQKPHLIPLFSSVPFILFLASIPFGEVSAWFLLNCFCMPSEGHDEAVEFARAIFVIKYGRNVSGDWMLMDHWRDGYEDPRYILTLFLFDVAMVCSLSMAVTLGVRTFIGIRQQRVISENKTKIELKLLITATAQTLVPFIFVYVPYFCCLNFPCFILPVETLADLCMFLTSCFPVYDAVIVIVLMKDYRHAVIGMVTRRRSVVPPSATVTPSYITTTVQQA